MSQVNVSQQIYSAVAGPSRRSSVESFLSIQDRETDVVRDTSDTDWDTEDDIEFEPTGSDPEESKIIAGDSSDQSDCDVIVTEVIEVPIDDADGVLGFADSEQTDSECADAELGPHDYWQCAQCNAKNNNPLYRYCEKCFKERKSLFPPRPKRKRKSKNTETKRAAVTITRDSDVESVIEPSTSTTNASVSEGSVKYPVETVCSQGSSFIVGISATSDSVVSSVPSSQETDSGIYSLTNGAESIDSDFGSDIESNRPRLKRRRASSVDRNDKRMKKDYMEATSSTITQDNSEVQVQSLIKSASHPLVTKDAKDSMAKKAVMNSVKEKLESNDNLCIMCYSEPKSGVFTHGKIAHICCCYKCAIKVWATAKRCPVCNCRVNNVLKAVVM